jgi:hypothetical protein
VVVEAKVAEAASVVDEIETTTAGEFWFGGRDGWPGPKIDLW